MIGIPWEIKTDNGYIVREKAGYIYGYNSYVAMVPEIRLGKYIHALFLINRNSYSSP
jgi:hypothetical protein